MIIISKATILPMLDIMERFNAGEEIRNDLSELLEHEDYVIELERYLNHSPDVRFTKDEFIDFFINIRTIDKESIGPKALKYRLDDMLYIMDNVDYYRKVYENVKDFDIEEVKKSLEKTIYGLPEDTNIEDFKIVFSIGLGMSAGWIYKNVSSYDLKLVLDSDSELNLSNTVAHECHHYGFGKIMRDMEEEKLKESMDSSLMWFLAGEGTAIKYCNNFEGKLTKKINREEALDVVQKSYDYYMDNFDVIYAQFRKDIEELRSGSITEIGDIQQLFFKNYFYRDVTIDGELKANYLAQPLSYNFGADVWGLIHDNFGREKVFELMRDPSEFFYYYNEALTLIGREDLCI